MLKRIRARARSWLAAGIREALDADRASRVSREGQQLLAMQYRLLRRQGGPLPVFADVGFRVWSEADEDGILLFIFSLIDTGTRRLVDLGAGGIDGSNSTNLLVHHGWSGLLVDGDAERVADLRRFYASSPDTQRCPPTIVEARLSAENVDAVLSAAGFTGEIDLLCIDIDGLDYWVWRALEAASPRVVLVEYQCIWGPDRSVAVRYRPDFEAVFDGTYGIYNSASLAAFVKLARQKNYRLVGTQRWGYNAFFVRNDVGIDVLPEVPAARCFEHPFTRWAIATFAEKTSALDWVEV